MHHVYKHVVLFQSEAQYDLWWKCIVKTSFYTKYWHGPYSLCSLQEEYPQWFEKPVLEMVHHNTVSLDKLVEMAWVEILTKYAVGEECDFLVSSNS